MVRAMFGQVHETSRSAAAMAETVEITMWNIFHGRVKTEAKQPQPPITPITRIATAAGFEGQDAATQRDIAAIERRNADIAAGIEIAREDAAPATVSGLPYTVIIEERK